MSGGGAVAWTMYLFLVMVCAELWAFETLIWATIWLYFGVFRACRGIYRRNVVGQTVETVSRRRTGPAAIVPDPYPQPVDLATLPQSDPWDGQMRRRS